jgi:hypothetical protein
MSVRRMPVLCTLVVLGLIASGCFGSSSTHPGSSGGKAGHQLAGHQLAAMLTGRVWTSDCGGPPPPSNAGCAPMNYRGSLVFCRSMNAKGSCPSARVDSRGHYKIALPRTGRWAVIPAPGAGNLVFVKPRWIYVRVGRTAVLDIRGGNLAT